MDPLKRKSLTSELQALVSEIAADLKAQCATDLRARSRAQKVHHDERVGEDFEVWLDLLSRRAAVLWVLKTVYVRVLEDRGLLRPVRIRDRSSQELFQHLAPGLGDTAYLRWIFRDLGSPEGLPELFTSQAAEVTVPSNAMTKKLLDFWRREDEATSGLRYRFNDEHFDDRLMGDLYQELDPVVKQRYALLQTPDFVVDFILDETLPGAINDFGVENVRVLDPACGSGHFLLAAFKRLVGAMRKAFPQRTLEEIVPDVLARVVGIDLNDYACALARARLLMTAVEYLDNSVSGLGARLHPQIFWADGLEQAERDEQVEMAWVSASAPRASLTRPESLELLRPILKSGFHVVVANPPYIGEPDPDRKAYHRQRVQGSARYRSAHKDYSLGAPFTERALQLCVPGGYVGEITANSFMRRDFGKALIEEVLPSFDLRKVIDTSHLQLAGHGTPTVVLILRRQPPRGDVLVVMSKRGQRGKNTEDGQSPAWRSLMAGHSTPGYEDEFISVSHCKREELQVYPWAVGGGGVSTCKRQIESASVPLKKWLDAFGRTNSAGINEAYMFRTLRQAARRGVDSICMGFVVGEAVRGWSIGSTPVVVYPYEGLLGPALEPTDPRIRRHFWPLRSLLRGRSVFGKSLEERGKRWFEHIEQYDDKLRTAPGIAQGQVATHNEFAFDESRRLFKETAPIIKLSAECTRDQHFAILACLNSSAGCLWAKAVCQNKGIRGEGGGVTSENWEQFFQFSSRKFSQFPIAKDAGLLSPYSIRIDQLARARDADSVSACLESTPIASSADLRTALGDRRTRNMKSLLLMVALQEELDWFCYRLYGLDPHAPAGELRAPDQVGPYRPGLRPFEITLARDDKARRDAIELGEVPDETPTAWFQRHGWAAATSLEEHSVADRAIVEARLARTEASRELALVEQAPYKRRWYHPDFEAEECAGLELWLADRIEDWAQAHGQPFTVEDATTALQSDAAVLSAAEVLVGRPDFNLLQVIESLVHDDSVPNQKHHVFKPSGLTKRSVWERTWSTQRIEDAATESQARALEQPLPPRFAKADYLRDSFWPLRGALDVPKERFVALTEVPGRTAGNLLFAWAGLTHRERAKVLVELDEQAERAGIPRESRIGLLHSIWFLADYVAWESESAANEYRAAVTAVVGSSGVTDDLLNEWATAAPAPPFARAMRRSKLIEFEDSDEP